MLSSLISRTFRNKQMMRYYSDSLKGMLADCIPLEKVKLNTLKEKHGNEIIGDVTVNQCINGSRGIKSLYWEPSLLDANEGIRIRGLSISECQAQLPAFQEGGEIMPEGMFWLLLTGKIPNKEQLGFLTQELLFRCSLNDDVVRYIQQMAAKSHPMNTLSVALSMCQSESHFMEAYQNNVPKQDYWETTYEDVVNIVAKLPMIASMIYRIKYRGDYAVPEVNHNLDYAGNFCEMLGYKNKDFHELMRLYLSIHSDHEGGNASAHTTHLVGSTLADPYISYASGLNALAGPLHGLANAEVLKWIYALQDQFQKEKKPLNQETIREFTLDTLENGNVIPGYGHAVLRKTDPRYTCQREFALKHLPNDPLFKIVDELYQVVPGILESQGKVQNPYPNVDNHSGVLLTHYEMHEYEFYTVLFGVSRAMGALSQLFWDRALQLPIERPKSMNQEALLDAVQNKKYLSIQYK